MSVKRFVKGQIEIRVDGDPTQIKDIVVVYDYSIPYLLRFSSARSSKDENHKISLPKCKIDLIHVMLGRNLTSTEKRNMQILIAGAAPSKFIFWRNHMFIQGSGSFADGPLEIKNFGKTFPVKLIEVYYLK